MNHRAEQAVIATGNYPAWFPGITDRLEAQPAIKAAHHLAVYELLGQMEKLLCGPGDVLRAVVVLSKKSEFFDTALAKQLRAVADDYTEPLPDADDLDAFRCLGGL